MWARHERDVACGVGVGQIGTISYWLFEIVPGLFTAALAFAFALAFLERNYNPVATTPRVSRIRDTSNIANASERKQAARQAVGQADGHVPPSAPAPISSAWRSRLIHEGESNHPKSCLANAITAFEYAPQWHGIVGWDEFSNRITLRSAPPWRSAAGPLSRFPRDWSDADSIRAAEWLQREHIMLGKEIADQAIDAVSRLNPFNPPRDYLESLRWDGIERLSTWLSVYLGADYNPITSEFGTRFLISCVARIFEPGCKVDTILILEGPQGKKKSSLLAILAGRWFTDQIPDIRKKDAAIQLEGVWILEFAELTALDGPSAEKAKQFISQQTDRYRPVWGKHPASFPRRCVFVGTTNRLQYLHDDTGNRRYWPVMTGDLDLDLLREDRDQLWAEATARYLRHDLTAAAGSSRWWFDPAIEPDLVDLAEIEQQSRYLDDPWDSKIARWILNRPQRIHDSFISTSVEEVMEICMGIRPSDWTHADKIRVARALRLAKWERYRANPDARGEREWRYRPAALRRLYGSGE